jgi:alpha-ketoglutarate-dependent taurine dioxygenase
MVAPVSICVIPNIDINEMPPTPSSGNEIKLPEVEKVLRAYANHYGHPFGYVQEQGYEVFQQIVPIKRLASVQISSSSTTELDLHTETAFHPYRPDFVLLLCLRGDAAAFTTYANLETIIRNLGETTQRVLRQPWYTTRIDESFLLNGQEDKTFTLPVLQGEGKDTSIVYDRSFMKGTTTASRNALIELEEAIKKSTRKVALKTGELMVIDNKTTVHGRLPFTPRYDGTDRWIMRSLVTKTLPPSDQMHKETIITVL